MDSRNKPGNDIFMIPNFKTSPGPWRVHILRGQWVDEKRGGRAVPYKIFHPGNLREPVPVVLWSHGLGGAADNASYLGKHLASHGYAAAHIQHIDSDESVWRGSGLKPAEALKAFRFTPEISLNRFGDVPFALDSLAEMNAGPGPLAGRLDLAAVGMSGHSYGALSTLVAAGMPALLKTGIFQNPEPRIKAAVTFSPSFPRHVEDLKKHYADIKIPMLHMTGTEDHGVLWEMDYTKRFAAFENIARGDQYLLVLKGGDHYVFAGLPFRKHFEKDGLHHELICAACVLFWDACLKKDQNAKALLQSADFAAILKDEAFLRFREQP